MGFYFNTVYFGVTGALYLFLLYTVFVHKSRIRKFRVETGIVDFHQAFFKPLKKNTDADADADLRGLYMGLQAFILGTGIIYYMLQFSNVVSPVFTIFGFLISLFVLFGQLLVFILTYERLQFGFKLDDVIPREDLNFFKTNKKMATKMWNSTIVSTVEVKAFKDALSIIPKIKETETLLNDKKLEYTSEREELKDMYLEACELLRSYENHLYRSIGMTPPDEAVEKGIHELKQKTEELRTLMQGTNHPTKSDSEHFVVKDLKRLLSHETIAESEKEEILMTITEIESKTLEMERKREKESADMDVHATLQSARKLFALDDDKSESLL